MGSGGLSTFDSRRTCPWWRKAEKGPGPSSSGSRAASGPQAALLPQSRAGGGESGAWPGPHGADSGCRSVSRGGARPAGKLESPVWAWPLCRPTVWACRPGAAVKLGPSAPVHCGTPRNLAHAGPWQHATPSLAPRRPSAPRLPDRSFINHLAPPASWAHPQLRQSALPKSCLGCYSASEWVRFVGRPLQVPHRMGGPAWPGPSKAAHVIGLNRRSCAANRCKSLPWDCVVLRKIASDL
jgi:hypothetical protein